MTRVEVINMGIAAYFQALRVSRRDKNGRKLTQASIAEMVGDFVHRKIDQSQISRIEAGSVPEGDVQTALIVLLDGDIEDIIYLTNKKDVSRQDGENRALKLLAADIPSEEQLEGLISNQQYAKKRRRVARAKGDEDRQ